MEQDKTEFTGCFTHSQRAVRNIRADQSLQNFPECFFCLFFSKFVMFLQNKVKNKAICVKTTWTGKKMLSQNSFLKLPPLKTHANTFCSHVRFKEGFCHSTYLGPNLRKCNPNPWSFKSSEYHSSLDSEFISVMCGYLWECQLIGSCTLTQAEIFTFAHNMNMFPRRWVLSHEPDLNSLNYIAKKGKKKKKMFCVAL